MLDQKKNIAFIKTNLIPKLPNSMNRLEDISLNVGFREKVGKFGPKRAQKDRNQIFPRTFTGLI